MDNSLQQLKDYLTKLADGGLCVAFSGGVDSSVLLKLASMTAQNVHAVTIFSDFHSPIEKDDAEKQAKQYGATFKLLEIPLPDDILNNPPNRCYLCKRMLFTKLKDYAAENGLATVIDGTNLDDLSEYRPGLKALQELAVSSPLAELKISKQDVRSAAKELGIEVAEKPSTPCLATRIPYNTRIDRDTLEKIDRLETFVKALGFTVVRARIHGNLVRIEVPKARLGEVVRHSEMVEIFAKTLGFSYITLDLCGFRSGSFDIETQKP